MNIQEKEINSNNVQRKLNQINEAYKENAQTILVQFTFEELLSLLDEPNYSKCIAIINDTEPYFSVAQWSLHKHQARKWWYKDHLTETMNIAIQLWTHMNTLRQFDFSIQDCILILFLHDLEKIRKYSNNDSMIQEFKSHKSVKDFVNHKIEEYWFELTTEQLNGLKYIHWEWDDYNPTTRVQSWLAAFLHICDTRSARIWFDYPRKYSKAGLNS